MLAVDETPVNGTPISSVREPKLLVKDCPVGIIISCLVISTSPIEDVADTPVNPTTSAGKIDPTVEVACTPVNPITSAGAILPTLAVVVTPVMTGVESITKLREPILDVADTPVIGIKFSMAAVNDPTLDVILNPAGCSNLLNESP